MTPTPLAPQRQPVPMLPPAATGQGPAVLLVGNFNLPGNHSVCNELSVQLRRLGRRVITTTYRRGRVSRLVDILRTIWRERSHYELANVDVYSGLAFLMAEAACGALHQLGKPYTLNLRGGNLPEFALHHSRRVRRLLGRAAAVTVPSPYLRQAMEPYCRGLQLIPNAIHIDRYPIRKPETIGPRLVWMRAFQQAVYNPLLAPRVIAQLRHEFPDIRLRMYGADKGDGSLGATRQLAAELGVAHHVQIHLAVPKESVPAHLAEGDIFLNTNHQDNTPVTLLEAMASGLCVVATRVGGIPHLVRHEAEALLVPPDDPRAMAQAVRRLLTDRRLASRICLGGRRLAESYDWKSVLSLWHRVLQPVGTVPRHTTVR